MFTAEKKVVHDGSLSEICDGSSVQTAEVGSEDISSTGDVPGGEDLDLGIPTTTGIFVKDGSSVQTGVVLEASAGSKVISGKALTGDSTSVYSLFKEYKSLSLLSKSFPEGTHIKPGK